MDYLFYLIYARQKTKLGESPLLSVLSGILIVTLVAYLSLFDIYLTLKHFGLFATLSLSKVRIIGFFFFLLVLKSIYFLRKEKYQKIEQKYIGRSRKTHKEYKILIISYITMIVVYYFVIVNLLHS
jgi:hypothetical protein